MGRGMRYRSALASSLLCLSSCLQAPAPRPLEDGGIDAGAPGFALESVVVEDLTGTPWPADAAPRQLVVLVRFTSPLAASDDPPPVVLLEGSSDDALLEDAARAPLRADTRAREVPTERTAHGALLRLRAPRLPRGQPLTLLLPAWLEGEHGRLDAPLAIPLAVSDAPEAGTAPVGAWPADGTTHVSTDLASIAIHLDGPLPRLDGVGLRDEAGRSLEASVAGGDCASLGWLDGSCVVLTLEEPLRAHTEHTVWISEAAKDQTGAPLGPWTSRLRAGPGPDRDPPVALPLPCALDELTVPAGCARVDDRSLTVRLTASEPVLARLAVLGRQVARLAPRGEATLRLEGLDRPEVEATLTLEDLAGLRVELPLHAPVPADLPTVQITEVRANPYGPEPQQEYVEVENFGDAPVELLGLALGDRLDALGDLITRPFTLAAGQRVLLVADRFDPADPEDDPVPAGVPLLRLGASLATSGLSNAGEAVYLRDAAGRRLAEAPAVAVPEGRCLVRAPGAPPRHPTAFVVDACSPGDP